MNTIEKLRARLQDLESQADALIAKEEMTSEDTESFDKVMAEIETVKADIKRREGYKRMKDDAEKPAGRQTREAEITGGEERADADPWRGFSGAAEFGMAVHAACRPGSGGTVDERLQDLQAAPTNFHRETGSDDGYMVPPAMRDKIFEVIDAIDDLHNQVDTEPTASNQVMMDADESTPWGSTGIQAFWAAEAEQLTPSRLATAQRLLKLDKLYAYTLATEELRADAPRLESRLTKGAGRAIAWKASDSCFYGSGAGQPLGWFNSSAFVSVAKESGQAADTVVADNIAKMFARQLNPIRANWYINSDVLPELFTMTLGDQPIFVPPSAGFTQAPGGFLLGRPVIPTEHCKTVGDLGDIQFVDPLGYYSPRKSGIQFARSIHLYFDYDLEAFRWTFRMGGAPYLEEAITPANGSNSKSHFVGLAARA